MLGKPEATAVRGEPPGTRTSHRHRAAVTRFPPDVLVAVDVDAVELVLQVLVLHVRHVVDHFQDDEPGQHGQHEPLLEHSTERDRLSLTLRQRWVVDKIEAMGLFTKFLEEF